MSFPVDLQLHLDDKRGLYIEWHCRTRDSYSKIRYYVASISGADIPDPIRFDGHHSAMDHALR